MIQESHVGIGILGKEGAHAAMSSDFVLRRFWHLRRLLCVHGRYNFFRTAQVVMFSFFKNLAFPLPLFWFCFWSLANGTSAFDSLLVTCFNTFFTSLPPFFAGLFDRDVREDVLMASPQAYAAFKVQSPFTRRTFVYTLVSATYQSAVTYFFAFGMMWPNDILGPDGKPADLAVLGNVMITSVVITTNLSMLLAHSTVNYINFIAVGVGLLLFLIVFVFESVHYWVSLAPDGYGMGCTWHTIMTVALDAWRVTPAHLHAHTLSRWTMSCLFSSLSFQCRSSAWARAGSTSSSRRWRACCRTRSSSAGGSYTIRSTSSCYSTCRPRPLSASRRYSRRQLPPHQRRTTPSCAPPPMPMSMDRPRHPSSPHHRRPHDACRCRAASR